MSYKPLVELGYKLFEEKNITNLDFFENKNVLKEDTEEANNILKDIKNYPHAFVLACLMDRRIKAEKAWIIPFKVFKHFGTKEIDELCKFKLIDFEKYFNTNIDHIYKSKMAGIFYNGLERIKTKYNYNAASIWKNNLSSATVVYNFLEFNGVGQKISTMATNILARDYKIKFSDYCSIDISVDLQVKKVMKAMGIVKDFRDDGKLNNKIIYKARELNPMYPGVIDLACWRIGRNYCSDKKENAKCNNCEMEKHCEKCFDNCT
ncbi:hypothetical protein FACS189445_2560 [Spirochaetia bacterium]|nr:hypothetical protein FACS189445_2560 [Spirochaetia bacterium]